MYVSTSHPFIVRCISWSYAFCFFRSIGPCVKEWSFEFAPQGFVILTYGLRLVVLICTAIFFSCWSTLSLISGPRMYVRAMSTRSNGTFMASWVRFTNLNLWNCPQKLSALLRVPSKMVGGTPRIPPFGGAFWTGVVVVTFTDMVGGSSGRDPCRLTIGSSAVANASSNGPGAVMGSSGSGPQVSGWGSSDPDSDIIGDDSWGAMRSVVCTWICTVGVTWLFGCAGSFLYQWPNPTFWSFWSIQ